MRTLSSGQRLSTTARPFWRSKWRKPPDYPVVKTVEAASLVWAIFPALFEKDTLQQLPANVGGAIRNAGGYSKQAADRLLYPSPGSNGLIDLKNSGQCTLFARLKFPDGITGASILLNTSWLTLPGFDRFRLWLFPSEGGCRMAFRSEVAAGNAQIIAGDSDVLTITPNTEFCFAVSVAGPIVRFFFDGAFARQQTASGPFLQSSRDSDIFGIGIGHRGSFDGRDTTAFADFNFAAIFDEAFSDARIAEISANPTTLLEN